MSSKYACSFRCIDAVAVIGLLMLTATIGQAFELNPAAVIYKLPDQIEWKGTGGNRNAVLVGDPEKPGLYIVINKWLAGNNFSRPHFHPNDRFITVVCTENSVLFDCVIESPNVSGDDRSALALPGPVRLAVQVEEPT